ncbi:MAG: TetR family transcriptional regulator [Gemmatirosa sp.]|nr:TetR family transcriptional regulator [Gemmatirosa sp.]
MTTHSEASPPTDVESAATPTRERILQAAETLLRRYGPAKTAVVDVARALGMSHANVYRHFASKAALHDAVAERWLTRVSTPLDAIAAGPGPAAARLEAWVLALGTAKRRKVLDDPEMFATYHAVAEAARHVVDAHVATLHGQLAAIVRDGVASGEFAPIDPDVAARTIFDATVRFHHPHHVRESAARSAAEEQAVRRVLALLVAGLRAGAA